MNDNMNSNEVKNNKNFISNIKESFSGRKFRSGAYVTAVSAIVIVIVIVINMIISQMGFQHDLTSKKLYTLSQDTIKLINNIEQKVTIYLLAETGTVDPDFQRIAEEYDKRSDYITFAHKDPILYPKFASQYVDDEIRQNSFIVVNDDNGRAKYLDYSELIVSQFDYNTMSSSITGLDVEGELTSALQFVTSEELPTIYVVEGHGEKELGEGFNSLMERMNVEVKSLTTLTMDMVPEDCGILLINTPSSDFSEDEISMIKDYMASGGNAILTLDYKSQDFANYKSLIEYYGIEVTDGIVIEGDSNMHLPNYPHFLVPDVINHSITKPVIDNKVFVLSPVSTGLVEVETKRSSLSIEPLLQTSDRAYAKQDIYSDTLSKDEGDIQGPFAIGILASDTFDSVTSNMAIFSAETIFDDSMIDGYGNGRLLSGTISYMAGEAEVITIPSKSIGPEYIYITQQQGILWGALVVVVLPLGILVTGIVVSVKRRRR
ncbi:MAG TPA: GldG family protein [Clostridiales bacterium]|nr:GldG family protein [Clostridiales bacterium]